MLEIPKTENSSHYCKLDWDSKVDRQAYSTFRYWRDSSDW
jgi:hypothetical protein